MQIAGNIIIFIGIIFMIFGAVGIFKFKGFYTRILITAKIDTVGAFTLIIGIIIKHGFGFFTMKLVLLIVLMMIVNPLTTHMIARSAYLSGYKIDNRHVEDKDNEDNV